MLYSMLFPKTILPKQWSNLSLKLGTERVVAAMEGKWSTDEWERESQQKAEKGC